MAPAPTSWKSKLGNEYPKELIDRLDAEHHRTLKSLRGLPGNKRCADCTAPETNWASVNLGVFLCTRCASVHRGLGTHISKTKSCMGTYLWGPDEIARMREMGNERGARVYLGRAGAGGPTLSVGPETGDAALREWAVKKYDQRLWAVAEKEETEGTEERKGASKAETPPVTEGPILITKKKTPTEGASKATSGSAVAAADEAGVRAAAAARLAPTLRQPEQPTDDFLDDFFESLFKEEGGAKKQPISGSAEHFACGFPEPVAWIQMPPPASLEKKNPFLGEDSAAAGDPFFCDWGSAAPVAPLPGARKEAAQHGLMIKPVAPKTAVPAQEIDWFEGW